MPACSHHFRSSFFRKAVPRKAKHLLIPPGAPFPGICTLKIIAIRREIYFSEICTEKSNVFAHSLRIAFFRNLYREKQSICSFLEKLIIHESVT